MLLKVSLASGEEQVFHYSILPDAVTSSLSQNWQFGNAHFIRDKSA